MHNICSNISMWLQVCTILNLCQEEDTPKLLKEISHDTKESVTVPELSPTSSSSLRSSDYFADSSASRSSGSAASKQSFGQSLEGSSHVTGYSHVTGSQRETTEHTFTPPDALTRRRKITVKCFYFVGSNIWEFSNWTCSWGLTFAVSLQTLVKTWH